MKTTKLTSTEAKDVMPTAFALVTDLVKAGIVWRGDRETAIRSLCEGKSWSTGVKDDRSLWDRAVEIASSHGFEAEVDDSASSIDFVIRPL